MRTQEITKAVVDKDFEYSDIVAIMATGTGRRTIAAILQLCTYEESAMATNATAIASNVAKQEVAHTLKNWIWMGGGKQLWRKMEDEIEIRADDNADVQTEEDSDDDSLEGYD